VWGASWHGQFGDGGYTDNPGIDHGFERVPRPMPGISNATAISLGIVGRHTLVLLKDGTLCGWGNTDRDQIGAGVSGTFQKPVTPKIAGVKAVFASGNSSFAVRNDNTLWIWGAGSRGEWPLTEVRGCRGLCRGTDEYHPPPALMRSPWDRHPRRAASSCVRGELTRGRLIDDAVFEAAPERDDG
jgi:hypothetical protein